MIGIPALGLVFLSAQFPGPYLSAIRSLASITGPFAASLVAVWLVSTVVGEGTAYFWDYIDRNRVWEEYRIQKGKRVPDSITAEKKAEASRARLTVSPVFMGISLYILRRVLGEEKMDVTKAGMPESGAWGMLGNLVYAVFVWDVILFWIHATLHYFPFLYKHIHKKQWVRTGPRWMLAGWGLTFFNQLDSTSFVHSFIHSFHLSLSCFPRSARAFIPFSFPSLRSGSHEFKTVSVFTGGHLAFLDYLLMDRLPVLLTAWFCNMNIHTYLAFVCTYLYMASHAHCGFEHPWDPMQWLTAGNGYHDMHHEKTWVRIKPLFRSFSRRANLSTSPPRARIGVLSKLFQLFR